MISDENLRARLEAAGFRSNPSPATRGISSESARRGTPAFDDLMDELEDEWDLDDEELDNIVEIRRSGDSFEIRLKGETRWELLEDDEEEEGGGGRERGGSERRFDEEE